MRSTGGAEIEAHEVGLSILGPLRELDEVAFLRFASVYQAFESLEDFEAAIALLRAERGPPPARRARRRRPPEAAPRATAGGGTGKAAPPAAAPATATHRRSATQQRGRARTRHQLRERSTTTARHDAVRHRQRIEGNEHDGDRSGSAARGRARRPPRRHTGRGLTVERVFTTAGRPPLRRGRPGSGVTSSRRTGSPARRSSSRRASSSRTSGASTPRPSSRRSTSAGRSARDVRERSLKQLLDRVVLTYTKAGRDHGYFAPTPTPRSSSTS